MSKNNYRYVSEYKSKYSEYIAKAIEFILNAGYGATIGNITLAEILHYNIDDEIEFKKYKNTMGRIRKFLIDYGYILVPIRNVGYNILKPNLATNYCYRTYVKSSKRTLDKSKYVMEHIRHNLLDGKRLEEYQNFLQMNRDLIDGMEKTIKTSKYYDRKNYYDSIKD